MEPPTKLVPDDEFKLMYRTMMLVLKAERDIEKGPSPYLIPQKLNLNNTTLDEKTCTALTQLRTQQAEDTR